MSYLMLGQFSCYLLALSTPNGDKMSDQSKNVDLGDEPLVFVEDEESFIASIMLGIADADAGRLHTTEEVRQYIVRCLAENAATPTA
jgi:predicted transcriptional regulator